MGSIRTGLLLSGAANMLWGSVFVATGVGLLYTDPFDLVFLRYAVGGATVVAASFFAERAEFAAELRRPRIWALGAIYAIAISFQFLGQQAASASEASLISNLDPVLVPILAYFVLKDKISNYQRAATVLGFVGLFLVSSPSLVLSSGHLLGDLMLFLTSVGFAIFLVMSKMYGVSSAYSAFAITVTTSVWLAPGALLLGNHDVGHLAPVGWAAVLYLGIPCTVVPIVLYLRGLSMVDASQAATMIFVQLLTGFALATLVFGAPYFLNEIMGAASITVAIFLSSMAKPRESREALSSVSEIKDAGILECEGS